MPERSDQPNILFIHDDQHRFDYLGCAGAEFLNTPNLDRLAARGVRFTQCTTNSPVCAPARIGLATGLQPTRLGALDNRAYLPFSTRTYYQRLRDNGYRVGCIGKLDLAKPTSYNGRWGDRPCVFGWGFTHPEEAEGKMHAGNRDTPQGPYGLYLQERGLYEKFHQDYVKRARNDWSLSAWDSVLETEHFEDVYIGRRAARWIRQIPDDFPWHYFVSFVGPHNPFDPPTEYANFYRDARVPEPIHDEGEGKPRSACGRMKSDATPEQIAVTRQQYCGAIQVIDDQVGRMLDALEERDMLENTWIIFSSDHGEMLGDHGLYSKSVAYEPSLRVPLLAAGPGIEGGRTSEALVELIDINPTICELAGLPPQNNIDARSFAPVLRGKADQHRTETVTALRHLRAVRTDRYKLIENYGDVNELYDLQQDPEELRNLIEEQPDVARQLRRRLNSRFLQGGNRR